ncbi:hypothetical protein BKI52_05975 [marine bacterium AO1-C]|nr:hypothetical protein BKI52_05975 [marine bacterium AO1-C]
MPEPHTHYFEVSIAVSEIDFPFIDFKMAAWTPGSYLLREYAQHVETYWAKAGRKKAKVFKTAKNTWRVMNDGASKITFNYRVYAFDMTVRTNFLDSNHGYINPAALCMFVAGHQQSPATLTIQPYETWEKVTVPLPPTKSKKAFTYQVPDFDTLVDSPIEIGNHQVFSFEAANVPHHVAWYGLNKYDEEQLKKDFTAIVDASTDIFQEHPCQEYLTKDYTFIVHILDKKFGGLEHLNSTSLHFPRETFATKKGYARFLNLTAHEYFHLWNVKRIRPIELGPFDYEQENYTRSLWVAEGFTVYYENIILRKAGLIKDGKFRKGIAETITRVENSPGNEVQPVTDASWDAWIKAYRPNENSPNTTISYYSKGALIALMLDLYIIQETQAEKSLDDVMRQLYQVYYKEKQRGFSEEEIKQVIEEVAGKKMDGFFEKYIYGTQTLPYDQALAHVGVKLDSTTEDKAYLGISTSRIAKKLRIVRVRKDSPAYNTGLNVHDEIVKVNDQKVKDLAKFLEDKKVGDQIKVEICRDGNVKKFLIVLEKNPHTTYKLTMQKNRSDLQKQAYRKWLRKA